MADAARSRRTRRWAVRVVGLLVLGVVTTYAVPLIPFAAAHLLPPPMSSRFTHEYRFYQQDRWWTLDIYDRPLLRSYNLVPRPKYSTLSKNDAFEQLKQNEYFPDSAHYLENAEVFEDVSPPRFFNDEWLYAELDAMNPEGGPISFGGYARHGGWPFTSSRVAYVFGSGRPVIKQIRGGIAPIDSLGFLTISLRPTFPGFIFNAVSYAAIWLCLISGTRASARVVIRRRRRAGGLCPMCKYNIQSDFDAGCPECGWNRDGSS